MKLIEMTMWEATTPQNGVFPNVKILGQKSKNNRHYTDKAMQEAVALYEGKAVYVSHASKEVKHRTAPDRFGRLHNVRYDPTRKELRGDLTYLETHEMTPKIKEDLDRDLKFFGLSHVADGKWRNKDGIQVVESIERVASVDLVSDPATASSLLEQSMEPQATPAPEDNGPDPNLEALRAGINAILDKGGDTDAVKEAILAFVNGEEGEEKKDDEDTPDAPKEEQTELAKTVATLTEQVAALTTQVKTLTAKPKKYTTPTIPVTKLQEQTDAVVIPTDPDALREWFNK